MRSVLDRVIREYEGQGHDYQELIYEEGVALLIIYRESSAGPINALSYVPDVLRVLSEIYALAARESASDAIEKACGFRPM